MTVGPRTGTAEAAINTAPGVDHAAMIGILWRQLR